MKTGLAERMCDYPLPSVIILIVDTLALPICQLLAKCCKYLTHLIPTAIVWGFIVCSRFSYLQPFLVRRYFWWTLAVFPWWLYSRSKCNRRAPLNACIYTQSSSRENLRHGCSTLRRVLSQMEMKLQEGGGNVLESQFQVVMIITIFECFKSTLHANYYYLIWIISCHYAI